jgi:hypothetical protein
MAFPTGWPPTPAANIRSIRVFVKGTTTAAFADNAWLFHQVPGADPYVSTPEVPYGSSMVVAVPYTPMGGGPSVTRGVADPEPLLWCGTLRICNDDLANVLEFSFDGVNVHGRVGPKEQAVYRNRHEAGIALRFPAAGAAAAFRVEAW